MYLIVFRLILAVVVAEYAPISLNIDKNLVLSSVYDAIKGNNPGAWTVPNPNDPRNKRNINYYAYDDYKNDDYGEVIHPVGVKQQCKPEQPAVQTISISDHNWSNMGSSMAHAVKHLVTILALIGIPVLLLKAFIFPLKILMGLKSMAFANTLLLGTLLLKYLTRPHRRRGDDDDDDDGDDNNNNGNGNGFSGISSDIDHRFYYPIKTEDLENLDEGEIKTILKFIRMKNKKW